MRHRIENVWADYCWECDRGRWDEALALLGGVVAVVLAAYMLGFLLAILTAGNAIYGVPLIGVACWTRRGMRS